MLYQVDAPHFCAGGEVGKVAAPIIKYMITWNTQQIQDYCNKKNWKFNLITKGSTMNADKQNKNVDGKKVVEADPRFLTTDVGHNVPGYSGDPEAEQREAVQTKEETHGTRVKVAKKDEDVKVTVH